MSQECGELDTLVTLYIYITLRIPLLISWVRRALWHFVRDTLFVTLYLWLSISTLRILLLVSWVLRRVYVRIYRDSIYREWYVVWYEYRVSQELISWISRHIYIWVWRRIYICIYIVSRTRHSCATLYLHHTTYHTLHILSMKRVIYIKTYVHHSLHTQDIWRRMYSLYTYKDVFRYVVWYESIYRYVVWYEYRSISHYVSIYVFVRI